jgi:hypothetical protein
MTSVIGKLTHTADFRKALIVLNSSSRDETFKQNWVLYKHRNSYAIQTVNARPPLSNDAREELQIHLLLTG